MRQTVQHILCLIITLLTMPAVSRAQFFTAADAPNPTKFLPAPVSDECNPHFAQDIYTHFSLKAFRDSAYLTDMRYANYDYRSTSEVNLRNYYSSRHMVFFQPAFGLAVSSYKNPKVFLFLDGCRMSSNQMLSLIPSSWLRLRPFVRLREATFGTYNSARSYEYNYSSAPNNSFPSNEGTFGWLTGMVMSCLNPWQADTILSRAYQHGWFRQVSGGMWNSDMNTSRLLGTVAFARLMSKAMFRDSLRNVHHQVDMLLHPDRFGRGGAVSPTPSATISELMNNDTLMLKLASFIPTCADENNGGFQSDMSRYLQLKALRDSIDENLLMGSGYDDIENQMEYLGPVVGVGILPNNVPNMHNLLLTVAEVSQQLCDIVRAESVMRRRPYEVFGHEPYTLEDLNAMQQSSSYPSAYAARGVATALALSMIAPHMTDTLMQVGLQYGLNRGIAGTSWYSDIEAGKWAGCIAIALVATGSDFLDLLDAAQSEYIDYHDAIITESPTVRAADPQSATPLYTIDGRLATPQSRGLLVGKNRKIIVR